ncbi:hypothetical protein JCM10908_000405 [Rhodotorula pacifica]|uniref:Scp160p n=1 Tax=Rhodotorula pacifica TaxID=1495444 RepID=UPI003176B941
MANQLSAAQRMQLAHEQAQQSQQQQQQSLPILTEDPFPVLVTQDPFPTSSTSSLPPPIAPYGPKSGAAANNNADKPEKKRDVDVSDESAFPSLGQPVSTNRNGAQQWGAAALRAKQQNASTADAAASSRASTPSQDAATAAAAGGNPAASFYSTTVQLPNSAIHIAPPSRTNAAGGPRSQGFFSNERREAPTTLGGVVKEVMRKHDGVQIDASSNRTVTTVILKARGPKAESRVERARTELLAWLEKKVNESVDVPKSLRALIIGSKGRTLKSITDSTGAHIQIPRDDDLDESAAAQAPAAAAAEDDEDSLGPLISISLSGSQSAVEAARAQILAIVRERTAKTTTRLPDVPSELWALLGARVPQILERAGAGASAAADEEDAAAAAPVRIDVPRRNVGRRGVDVVKESGEEGDAAAAVNAAGDKDKAVSVSGDKDLVKRVVSEIEAELAELRATVRPVTFPLPKRQHRFLVGSAIADRILRETGCAVEVPSAESQSEDVVVRGPGRETVKAMQMVMDLASAAPVESLDLFTAHRGPHDPRVYATNLARYLIVRSRLRPIALASGTQIYLPRLDAIPTSTNAWLEIVGSTAEEGTGAQGVAQARQAVIGEVRRLPPGVFDTVEIDSLVHRHLIGRKGSKVRQYEKDHSVDVVFPPPDAGRSDVLLVYTGEHFAGPEAKAALEQVKTALESLAGEFADLTTATVEIPTTLHGAVIGQGGTTLNAVIGEDKLVHVQFGNTDEVTIRGPKDEVERVRKELERITLDARNEEIVNSHVIEFEIPSEQVRHVVGKSGAGINKLREELGVRVDFGEQAAGKKAATSQVTIKGRKENAEEAQRRIRSLATRMADETTLSLPLPSSLDRGSLIGKQGTYLKRLEEKYDVRINFPRDGRKADDASSAPSTPSSSEITIRGPSKGAKAAQGELVALIEYEKEHGNTSVFEVPVKALPRILGRGGAQVNQIKDDTGVASVDVDQKSQEAATATITLRGTKSAIKKAREAIEAIANEVQDELRLELDIPREYHMTLIGSGGSNIRELIARCGGPSDARASGNTVRFPRQGDERQIVTITAPSAVATKVKEALEAEVASLASRVTWGVVVPNQNHAAVIGKGAQSLRDLQRKHSVKVIMPGWDEYATSAAPENQDELAEADERDIVKVLGPKEAAIAAAADLQAVKGRGNASGTSTPAAHSVEVIVPKRLHAQVAQGGRFFRSLPSGTRVSHRGVKPPSSALKSRKPPAPPAANGTPAFTGRIDDEVDASNGTGEETGLQFQLVPLIDSADATGEDADETIPWVIESRSQEDAEQVAEEIRRTLSKAQEASHVGWVTVPQGLMPRIVGRGGAGLDRLRATGVDVEVVGKRDANQLTLTGSPSAIDAAYDIIRELNAPRAPRRQRDQDYENNY